MGQSKQLWIAECERVEEAYLDSRISRTEAFGRLMALGHDEIDADNLLDAIEQQRAEQKHAIAAE